MEKSPCSAPQQSAVEQALPVPKRILNTKSRFSSQLFRFRIRMDDGFLRFFNPNEILILRVDPIRR